MIYLICQDWANTSNNHAGIKYLCETLERNSPSLFKTYTIPYFLDETNMSTNRFLGKVQVLSAQYRHRCYIKKLAHAILSDITTKDVVILMEYMEKFYPLLNLAQTIKNNMPTIKMYGMVHLVPSKLNRAFPDNGSFLKWVSQTDGILTLGSSLTSYFESRGVNKEKLHTMFHYVDNKYYKRSIWNRKGNRRLKVIAMGNQMRNMGLLKRIVANNPEVDFTICQGVYHIESIFEGLPNVNLIPFVSENTLKKYMEQSDISLNVMEDTIGSNVIVTSMAMGLAMICSDVGSIRDYCNESNCIFCDNSNEEEFSRAINTLQEDSLLCQNLKVESAHLAERLTIENFAKELLELQTMP